MSFNQSEPRKTIRRATLTLAIAALVTLLAAVSASAHTSFLHIEGAFSDRLSGSGMAMSLEDSNGNVLWKGKLDDYDAVESVSIPGVWPLTQGGGYLA